MALDHRLRNASVDEATDPDDWTHIYHHMIRVDDRDDSADSPGANDIGAGVPRPTPTRERPLTRAISGRGDRR